MAEPRQANGTMVKEFYREARDDVVTPFQFRGAIVEITVDIINEYYGCIDFPVDE